MTNQEAIKELSEWLDACCGGEEIEPTREAFRMAIEALKVQIDKDINVPNNDDIISRQAALNAPIKMVSEGLEWVPVYHLKDLPSAQPEIIRCKDCKYGSPNGKYGCKSYHYRLYETHEMKPDDFCSFAERRTDE